MFDNILISSPNEGGGLFFVSEEKVCRLDSRRTTGIYLTKDLLLRGLQQNVLVKYHNNVRQEYECADFDDIHDTLFYDGHVYLVSTEHNQLIKLTLEGRIVDKWVLEGDRDASHINCMGVWQGRVVYSAFGDFKVHRGYKGCSDGQGFVRDLQSGQILISGLSQPHSLVEFGHNLLIANSERGELVEYSPSGQRLRSALLGGYVRGLAATNRAVYVGLSRSRNSQSDGVQQATLLALEPETFAVMGQLHIDADEIYDIRVVPDLAKLAPMMAIISQASVEYYEHSHKQLVAQIDLQNRMATEALAQYQNQIMQRESLVSAQKIELVKQAQKIEQIQHDVSAILLSRSWYLTAPYRQAGNWLKSVLARINARVKSPNPSSFNNRHSDFEKELLDSEQTPPEDRNNYQEWVKRFDSLNPNVTEKIRFNAEAFFHKPKFSVLMPVFDPPLHHLEAAILSVQNQIYPHWELCIADDASTNPDVRKTLESYAAGDQRIKLVCRPENGHISAASNSALALASGDFVALLDHDDLLPPQALFWVAEAINRFPDAGLIYSDEDKITEIGERYDPYFKSALNYELLLAQNMISHLGVYRRDLLLSIGGFRQGFEGAQDYDLVLRVLEKLKPKQVVHIPRILYHWRAIPGSTATDVGEKEYAADAARNALSEHLQRTGRRGDVMPAPEVPNLHRVRYALPANEQLPLVSIIIPTRDRADLLKHCLASIQAKTTYKHYEILIVDNGSVEEVTHQFFAKISTDQIRVLRDDSPFNYAKLNNNAVRQARGDVLCFMNNDIEIQSEDWIEEMLSFALQQDIGCVGARLWYPNNTLQHGGVVCGIGGVAGHAHKHFGRGVPGYFHRAVLSQNFSAVTGACLMIRKSVCAATQGFNENLKIAFNDVDLCLRVSRLGYRNVWTPYAEMIHHESASRGHEDTPEKIARFNAEADFMRMEWKKWLPNDLAYSPNLTLDYENFSLAWPPGDQTARINPTTIFPETSQ